MCQKEHVVDNRPPAASVDHRALWFRACRNSLIASDRRSEAGRFGDSSARAASRLVPPRRARQDRLPTDRARSRRAEDPWHRRHRAAAHRENLIIHKLADGTFPSECSRPTPDRQRQSAGTTAGNGAVRPGFGQGSPALHGCDADPAAANMTTTHCIGAEPLLIGATAREAHGSTDQGCHERAAEPQYRRHLRLDDGWRFHSWHLLQVWGADPNHRQYPPTATAVRLPRARQGAADRCRPAIAGAHGGRARSEASAPTDYRGSIDGSTTNASRRWRRRWPTPLVADREPTETDPGPSRPLRSQGFAACPNQHPTQPFAAVSSTR